MLDSLQKGTVRWQASRDEVYACFDLGPDYQVDSRPGPVNKGVFLEKGGKANNSGDETPVEIVRDVQ